MEKQFYPYRELLQGDIVYWLDTNLHKLLNQLGAEFIHSSNPDNLSVLSKQFDFIISTLNVVYDLDAF